MPIIPIEVTAAELFALDLIASDKQVWADNVLTHRAWKAKEDLKPTPEWTQALTAYIQGGGNATGEVADWAILLKGKELGIFKTAAEKEASRKLDEATGVEVPVSLVAKPAHVDQEVTKRKMTIVGAASAAEMNDIVVEGMMESTRLLNIKSERELTQEEKVRAAQLNGVAEIFAAFKEVADLIKADILSGAITNISDVADDPRWPSFPE